ncbi:MAG: hypothetical protein BWY09_02173 [Candidatus Hydrogenedentes bacterium ADurb.Bin179]|nr:MAG: hypothetical protein BWY09_02173 [Candidatus Hydrogenedentes bacterium ADurb.Bin179]
MRVSIMQGLSRMFLWYSGTVIIDLHAGRVTAFPRDRFTATVTSGVYGNEMVFMPDCRPVRVDEQRGPRDPDRGTTRTAASGALSHGCRTAGGGIPRNLRLRDARRTGPARPNLPLRPVFRGTGIHRAPCLQPGGAPALCHGGQGAHGAFCRGLRRKFFEACLAAG